MTQNRLPRSLLGQRHQCLVDSARENVLPLVQPTVLPHGLWDMVVRGLPKYQHAAKRITADHHGTVVKIQSLRGTKDQR